MPIVLVKEKIVFRQLSECFHLADFHLGVKIKTKRKKRKKTRCKSLTNYIRQSLQIATTSPSASIQSDHNQQPVEEKNNYENDDQNKIVYDRLRNNNESALRLNNDNVFEPDPDYWDLPYNKNLNNFNEYISYQTS